MDTFSPPISKRALGPLKTAWERIIQHPLAKLGPGLITGVADDDPSGIATYSQAGAQFGLNMLWTMPLAFPLMAAIQSMCARIGRVTGKGLAANIKVAFPPYVLNGVVVLLLVANVFNIAADIASMGEVTERLPRQPDARSVWLDGHPRDGLRRGHDVCAVLARTRPRESSIC
jgi:Natural resistance-associated macrophage protein